jgi:actin-like ATPase involved in cell morphogenesis
MTYVLGIDLGTSYSAAAVALADGRIEMAQLGSRTAAIPSLIVVRADGEALVGEAAERRALVEAARTAREFKRRLGDPVPFVLGGAPYGPDALLAILLRSILRQVRAERDEAPAHVVIAHPASYGPYKVDLLRQVVRQAEVPDATFVTEPVAAAIDYTSRETVPTGATIAVYDFGGGTFDATILEKTAAGFDVLGTPEGLERLGGADIDEAVFRHVADVVGDPVRTLDLADPATVSVIARLREECRRAKESLSVDSDTVIPVFLPGFQGEVRLTRAELERMIEPRIAETLAALARAAQSGDVRMVELDRILLVGGTSRIPRIAERVRAATGRPVAVDAHPKHGVALGAARVAVDRLAAIEAGHGRAVTSAAPAAPANAGRGAAKVSQVAHIAQRAQVVPSARPSAATAPVAATRGRGTGGRSPWLGVGVAFAGIVLVVAGVLASGVLGAGGQVALVPTLPPAPSALPLRSIDGAPAVALRASIDGITLEAGHYRVDFSTVGFDPAVGPNHVHLFWDNVPQSQAGVPGSGPWIVYMGGSPFVELAPADRPEGASGICILVANHDHSVLVDTGNCVAVP